MQAVREDPLTAPMCIGVTHFWQVDDGFSRTPFEGQLCDCRSEKFSDCVCAEINTRHCPVHQESA